MSENKRYGMCNAIYHKYGGLYNYRRIYCMIDKLHLEISYQNNVYTYISDINKSCYIKCADFSTCIIDLMYLRF